MARHGDFPQHYFIFLLFDQEMQTNWKDDEENTKDKPRENKGMRKMYYSAWHESDTKEKKFSHRFGNRTHEAVQHEWSALTTVTTILLV